MIEIIFTVDYEIYGNGVGSLTKLVYEPTERLRTIFNKWNARFVVFAEVAEMEIIEANGADPAIELLKKQLKDLLRRGHEIGLHIHPWWYNARHEKQHWTLDQTEYNLCSQPVERINQIVDRAIAFMRRFLGVPDFSPISFRAGHLLFQPTQPLGEVLARRGIRLDSSVYKGGLWRQHMLDYRRAPKSSYYWKFRQDVAVPNPQGELLEVPIYTQQAPIWKLFTSKRLGLQQSVASSKQVRKRISTRLLDFMRFHYPLKFDLGQMTKEEIIHMLNGIVREGQRNPSTYCPIVAIMHTKDPIDFEAIDSVLDSLDKNRIKVSTFAEVVDKIKILEVQTDARA
jgi:hypothetical protein